MTMTLIGNDTHKAEVCLKGRENWLKNTNNVVIIDTVCLVFNGPINNANRKCKF